VIAIHGYCDLRFGSVLDAFREQFTDPDELGAAAAVVVDGAVVVDLWAGCADAGRTRPWTRNTVVPVFGISQLLSNLCVLILAGADVVELEAPVARYWPEFGDGGKVPLTVRQMLQQAPGLPQAAPGFDPTTLLDWDAMTGRIAADDAHWSASRAAGFHALTFGYVVGEVVRRVSGRTVGSCFHDEVARPLAIDVHLGGLGPEQDHRIADVVPLDATAIVTPQLPNPNGRAWRQAEIPSANGAATARGLARLMGVLAHGGEHDDVRLLSPALLQRAVTSHLLAPAPLPETGAPHAITCRGAGGAFAMADRDARVGAAYVPNGLRTTSDPRAVGLVAAVYEAL
jgi:CubicO group peptidase (beta-lactamase class C family)